MYDPPPSPSKLTRSRPLSFALPSSSSVAGSFNSSSSSSRPLSPDLASHTRAYRPSHRSTASLSSLAQLNLNSSHAPPASAPSPSPLIQSPKQLERSPSLHWGTFSTAQTTSNNANAVGREFEDVQNRTFAKWLNARLEPHGYPAVNDLGTDFSDGTRLIQLIEVLTEESMGRFNQNPVLRVQKMENTKQALDRIKEMGVHLTNIGPEDIVDGNRKLILGMIWSLVLRFSIADINEEGSHAKEGLLLWCQRKTADYEQVDVKDFARSWMDGLAFCALIHRHRPDLLEYDSLPKDSLLASSTANLSLAFEIAEQHLGIPRLLDVEDVCGPKRPDERSIMTYVAQFFHAFSSKAQQENESRVISHFVDNMSELMLSVHDYERRVTTLLASISTHLSTLAALPPPAQTPFPTLKSLLTSFTEAYYLSTRRAWWHEVQDVSELLFRIREKLKTYGLKPYDPVEGYRTRDVELKWHELEREEHRFVHGIRHEVDRCRRQVHERVEQCVTRLEQRLRTVEKDIKSINGPLEGQLEQCRRLVSDRVPELTKLATSLSQAEADCEAYDVPVPVVLSTFNPVGHKEHGTIHCGLGLQDELNLLEKNLRIKISFIEHQIVARRQTLLKPEQLEEFESAFRAFDKDERNKLDMDQLVGALGSLGVAEINLEDIQTDENEQVEFQEFIRFLTERSGDRLTGEKVRSCFRSVASDKGYITELDLTRLQLPTKALQFLQEHMPQTLLNVPVDQDDNGEHRTGRTKEEIALDYEEFLNQFLE
ncbi:uncharacterized protein JCM15063_004723 [Sporobolomyces koalae]|uniref:uncharacterized protein n=1 Tax=Sporobolomyces koalae TaxID=500713 RepID=UPI0031780F34